MGPFQVVDSFSGLHEIMLFYPSITAWENQVVASVHRFGRLMPPARADRMQHFKTFAKSFIQRAFRPLDWGDLHSVDEWLEQTSYNGQRKLNLAELSKDTIATSKTNVVKSFIKAEGYSEPKNARGINSPSDHYKSLLGALTHDVDKHTFKTKWFVKGSNPRDWPVLMQELFGLSPCLETDFSSFEAHHHGVCAEMVKFWYMHMIRNVVDNNAKRWIATLFTGRRHIKFKHITTWVCERLMSGAMWTSSANGVLNLLLMSYMSAVSAGASDIVDFALTKFKGLFEGDDGLCCDYGISPGLINEMGLVLKFKKVGFYGDASFCGVVCEPTENKVVTDPVKVLAKLPVLDRDLLHSKSSKQLCHVRAKAMSYMANYRDCPVVGPLCYKLCELTRGYSPSLTRSETSYFNSFELAKRENAHRVKPRISDASRFVVAKHFGVPVDLQLEWEESISRMHGVLEIDLSLFSNPDRVRNALTLGHPYGPCPPHPVAVAALRGEIRGKGRYKLYQRQTLVTLPGGETNV